MRFVIAVLFAAVLPFIGTAPADATRINLAFDKCANVAGHQLANDPRYYYPYRADRAWVRARICKRVGT